MMREYLAANICGQNDKHWPKTFLLGKYDKKTKIQQ